MSTVTRAPPKSAMPQAAMPCASTPRPEKRIAIRGLSWELYDALSAAIDPRQTSLSGV